VRPECVDNASTAPLPSDNSKRTRAALRRRAGLVRDQSGVALIVALGAMLVIGIVATTMIQFSVASERTAHVTVADAQAFWLAEAGMNAAVALLANEGSDATDPNLLPTSGAPGSQAYDTGTATWWGSYEALPRIWTVTGVGTVVNPSGGATVTKTVTQQYYVGTTSGDTAAWQYIFAADDTGCLTVSSSSQISQPLYASGDLCLLNSARVLAAASPVTVLRNIIASGSGGLGASGAPVDTLHVGGGCSTSAGGPFVFPCTSSQKVWATNQDHATVTLEKPEIDLAVWYRDAVPGPSHSCTSGSFPGGFDNDTVLNRSRADVNLFVSTYDCTVTYNGDQLGRIAFNASTNVLTLDGIIFFDGNMAMSGSQTVRYQGRGTIYASGTIALAGSQKICATTPTACNFTTGAWQPETNLLVLVAGNDTVTPAFTLGQSAQIQGAFYSATGYTQGSSVKFQGPVIADTVTLTSSSQANYVPFNTLPPGTPAVGPLPVTVIPGTWDGDGS
jgi:Tfp pilus assembly protein PilX